MSGLKFHGNQTSYNPSFNRVAKHVLTGLIQQCGTLLKEMFYPFAGAPKLIVI